MMDIRCLSLRQPWASLVAMREKSIETRSWRTRWRGPLLIHASGTKPDAEAMADAGIIRALRRCGLEGQTLPHGALLCLTRVMACLPIEIGRMQGQLDADPEIVELYGQDVAMVRDDTGRLFGVTALERPLGFYAPGRWAWMLEQPQPFTPVPCSGAQGLWRPDPETVSSLARLGIRPQAPQAAVR